VDQTDNFLYTIIAKYGGNDYALERTTLADFCTGALTVEDDKFVAVESLGSLLALRETQGHVTICDLKEKEMVAHFIIP